MAVSNACVFKDGLLPENTEKGTGKNTAMLVLHYVKRIPSILLGLICCNSGLFLA